MVSETRFLGKNFRGWDYSIFSLHGSGVFEDTDPEKIKSKHVLHAPDTGNHQNSSNFQKFQIRLNKMVKNSVEFSKKRTKILLKITILIENDQCWSKLITIIILIIPETSQPGGGGSPSLTMKASINRLSKTLTIIPKCVFEFFFNVFDIIPMIRASSQI